MPKSNLARAREICEEWKLVWATSGEAILAALNEVQAEEREACAKLADEIGADANMLGWQSGCKDVANAIRARKD